MPLTVYKNKPQLIYQSVHDSIHHIFAENFVNNLKNIGLEGTINIHTGLWSSQILIYFPQRDIEIYGKWEFVKGRLEVA